MSEPREPSFTAPPRFQIVRRIGAGGMGVVYEAIDRDRDLHVALKHLAEPSAATLYLFKREFHALAGITHPNLVPLYELISDGQQWFFTMELLDQATDFLTHVRGDRPPPHFARGTGADPEEATALAAPHARHRDLPSEAPAPVPAPIVDHAHLRRAFAQLATGVAALHRAGKLHRYLKPSNAMVRKDGRVVLVDFGLVVELRDHVEPGRAPGLASTPDATDAQIAGSVAYMAPEQAAGEPLSEASDWYAVGVMLFEALTGRLPIEGPPLVIWNSKQVV
ncbi:MAG TPA: serine/threonine-protein kinase, partial [Kofleriaceae bacterium]